MAISKAEARRLNGQDVVLVRDYDSRTFQGRMIVEGDIIKIISNVGPGRPARTHRSNVLSLVEIPASAPAPAPAPEVPRKVHAPAAPAVPFSAPAEDVTATAVSRALDSALESQAVSDALVALLRDAVHTPPVMKAVERAVTKALTTTSA